MGFCAFEPSRDFGVYEEDEDVSELRLVGF